jgi:hypothetical protein
VDEVEESTVGVVDYEMTNRELNERLLYECRCDERLNTKVKGDTRLTYTGYVKVYFIMNQEGER